MKKYLLLIASLISIPAMAEPTFEETKKWIEEKTTKYSKPYFHTTGAGTEFKTELFKFELKECTLTAAIRLYRYNDEKEEWKGYESSFYDDFEHKDYSKLEYWHPSYNTTTVHHYDSAPILGLSYNNSYKTHHYGNGVGQKYLNHLVLFFNYQEQEKDLVSRMDGAFKHLSKLAAKNPRCQKITPKETF